MGENQWNPIGWNQLGLIPNECWPYGGREGEEAKATSVYGPPVAIFTGEDMRAGYNPDNIGDLLGLEAADPGHWIDDGQKEDAAFRLLQTLKYDDDANLYHGHNGITDEMMSLANVYINGLINGCAGLDAVISLFREARWNTDEGQRIRHLIIDFCGRLRRYPGCVPEISEESQKYILSRVDGKHKKPSWWFAQLGGAIWGKARFERLCRRRW